jgi:hypothetical protein
MAYIPAHAGRRIDQDARDEIWRNGTALYYHFETQPIPVPQSMVSFSASNVLRIGVWFNWLAELVAPFFHIWPRIR